MKAIRTICPRCGDERTTRTELKDLYNYTEDIVYKKCPKCKRLKETPEEQLTKALFGKGK